MSQSQGTACAPLLRTEIEAVHAKIFSTMIVSIIGERLRFEDSMQITSPNQRCKNNLLFAFLCVN